MVIDAGRLKSAEILLDRVKLGDVVVIQEDGKPVAAVVPPDVYAFLRRRIEQILGPLDDGSVDP